MARGQLLSLILARQHQNFADRCCRSCFFVDLNGKLYEAGWRDYTSLLLFCVFVSLSTKFFPKECNKFCFGGFSFDVDFGCFVLHL